MKSKSELKRQRIQRGQVITLDEVSAECPKCQGKLWQIIVSKTTLRELDDIFAIECECGYRVEFREEP